MNEEEFTKAMNQHLAAFVAKVLELPETPELNLTHDEIIECLERTIAARPKLTLEVPETDIIGTIRWHHRFGITDRAIYTATITWPVV